MGNVPLAYLLTWTCYAAWLHGDKRGSVDRERNAKGDDLQPVDDARRRAMLHRLDHDPVWLDDAARSVVDSTIVDHCRIRSWWLGARM